jgi:hypothetical protein
MDCSVCKKKLNIEKGVIFYLTKEKEDKANIFLDEKCFEKDHVQLKKDY